MRYAISNFALSRNKTSELSYFVMHFIIRYATVQYRKKLRQVKKHQCRLLVEADVLINYFQYVTSLSQILISCFIEERTYIKTCINDVRWKNIWHLRGHRVVQCTYVHILPWILFRWLRKILMYFRTHISSLLLLDVLFPI